MAPKKPAPRPRAEASPRKRASARASTEERERYQKAVEAFERAVKNLYKGDLERARTQFESLVSDFPEEKELAERARVYLAICDRQARRGSTYSPRSFEEVTTYGVYWLNQGEYDKAVKYLTRAVEMEPRNDHAHYCLAAAYARNGDSKSAARHLRQAIHANPYNRVLAKTDPDLESLRHEAEIAALLSSADQQSG